MTSLARPQPAIDDARVEERTRRIGLEIFHRVQRARTRSWNPAEKLESAMMRAMMADEELRFRLLRFVDVFPSLEGGSAIAEHLAEYLASPQLRTRVRGPLTGTAARLGRLGCRLGPPVGWASRMAIRTMGRKFIAGESPQAVAPRLARLERRGFRFSLDLLGEFVSSEKQADEFQRRYLEMIEELDEMIPQDAPGSVSGPRVNVSIKLSSLTSKFDPMDQEGTVESVLGRLRPLARAAMESGAFLNIDMEKYEYRDTTLEIIRRLLSEEEFAGFGEIGTVAQAYLADAEESLAEFLAWLRSNNRRMTIRLVKGAYWDSEQIWAQQRNWPVPVLTDKRGCDAQYERMTRTLLESGDIVRTAIASHNVRSISYALSLAKEMDISRDQFEVQMLYGMAGSVADAIRDIGIAVRIYVPCGELIPGMAYLVRRLLENTANESFLRQRFVEHANELDLLADPKGPY